MHENGIGLRGNKIITQNVEENLDAIESRLKRRLGSGLFIHDTFRVAGDSVKLKVGTSYPKDVSDRRENDRVMKFINVGDIATLEAVPTGEGYHTIELPDRSELKSGFEDRRFEITNNLDWSMAKAIYSDIYDLDPVGNQLNSLIQIVRWLKKEQQLSIDRIDRIQGSSQTRDYIEVLEAFNYVRTDGDTLFLGEKMEGAEMDELGLDEYEKAMVGHIIADAYNVLRNDLDLRMLNHFPKFANSYYYSALQRENPDLHLRMDDLQQTLKSEWGDDVDPLILEDKMSQLEEAEVIEIDSGYVSGRTEIYESFVSGAKAEFVSG